MASIKPHTTTIDGRRYRTTTFSAMAGLDLLPRVLAVLPPSIADLMLGVSDDDFAKIGGSRDTLHEMLKSVARYAANTGGLAIVKETLRETVCENGRTGDVETEVALSGDVEFGRHFAADYVHLFHVWWWVVRCSFDKP